MQSVLDMPQLWFEAFCHTNGLLMNNQNILMTLVGALRRCPTLSVPALRYIGRLLHRIPQSCSHIFLIS